LPAFSFAVTFDIEIVGGGTLQLSMHKTEVEKFVEERGAELVTTLKFSEAFVVQAKFIVLITGFLVVPVS
jgi:hypothetical protein